MPDLLTILFIGLAALGLWLLAVGWRGRRIDNHPWCRKCRFDLQGLWPGAAKCPECGIDLERIDAVELGQRERRRATLALGVLIVMSCAIWIGMSGWKALWPVNWTQYKPDWWVAREARSADAETSDAALAELVARIESGSISDSRLSEVVTFALELQADDAAAWRDGWGDVIQAAWSQGSLDPDQILQFAQHAVDIQMETESPMARRWEFMRAGPRLTLLRAGSKDLTLQLTPIDASLGGIDVESNPGEGAQFSPARSRAFILPAKEFAVVAAPGEHELRVTWRATLSQLNLATTPAVWDVPLTAPLTVLAPAPGAEELVTDVEITAALRESIEVQAVGLRLPPQVMGGQFPGGPNRGRIVVILTLRDAPIAAHLQITAGAPPISGIFGSGQMRLDAIRGSSYQARLFIQPPTSADPQQISVIIRPEASRSPASGSPRPGSQQIWYGEPIEINDIPVTWYDTADDQELTDELRAIVHQPAGTRALPGSFEPGVIRGPGEQP